MSDTSGDSAEPAETPEPDAASPPEPEKPSDKTLFQVMFPSQATLIMMVGIIVGLLLIAAGFAGKVFLEQTAVQANVILAIGAGVLLAAFGGQASARFGPFVLAGVVAITAFFMWWLDRTERGVVERQVSGRIAGLDLRRFDVKIRNEDYAYARSESNVYDFVFLERDLRHDTTFITLANKKGAENCPVHFSGEDCVLTLLVLKEAFLVALAEGKPIEWRFDGANGKLVNSGGAEVSVAMVTPTYPSVQFAAAVSLPAFVSSAEAQQEETVENPQLLRQALADLTSDDIDTRRFARDVLGAGPLSWVKPIANHLMTNSDNYRIQLGCVEGLAQMLRSGKDRAGDIRARLSPEHVTALVATAGHRDPTMRIYSGEFLSELGDARVAIPAIDLAASTEDEDARLNLLVVVTRSIIFLDEAARRVAAEKLLALKSRSSPIAQSMIDEALKLAG